MVYLRVKKQTMNRILTFFLLFAVNSFGQHIKFENFTTNQGLSNNSVGDIESDPDGGLWIATWDGLNYFDGYNFKIFKNDFNNPKTISSNYITKLKKKEEEADLKAFKISISSPFGQGLFGKKVGDVAEITAPAGKLEFDILEISR